tara:strand:+ start:7903 stop:12249 length:4347 start_codon:yes stop_codon:yes gene_type:complete
MANLTTDFNVSPYYDDHDESKKYSRVLFKPAVAIQARELTQLQTLLQAQVERFGNNIYKEGTIIEGCQITFDDYYSFVKITDLDTAGVVVAPSTYIGYFAKGSTTGVVAQVSSYADGLVSQDPNLTTLYIDYIKAGTSGQKTFNHSETIEIHSSEFANDSSPIATITAAGGSITTAAQAVGDAFAVQTSEGIIYSKGHFLKVGANTVIASKYDRYPDNVSVGFNVKETIVTADSDNSLKDNAAGFNNENAPGADRLKLDPYLDAIPTSQARANTDFLALVDFQAGLATSKRFDTQWNSIGEEMAKKTKETSGSFTVTQNQFASESANTTHFKVAISPGLHYVNGQRAEQFNTTRIAVPKAIANASMSDVTVTTNQGYYVVCKELIGNFASNTMPTVSLRDTAGTSVTDGDALSVAPGNEIGTATLQTVIHSEGGNIAKNATYKVFLMNIKMSAGKRFHEVRSLHDSGEGTADIVLENDGIRNKAVLKEQGATMMLWPLPMPAIKETTSADFIFRTQSQVSVSTSNVISLSLGSGLSFPYSGTLTEEQKKDWIITANTTGSNLVQGVPLWTSAANIQISGTTANIDISGITSGAPSSAFNITYNARKASATPLKKTEKTIYVKLDTANNAATNAGPWSLGVPDVQSIEAVYISNTSVYANSTGSSFTDSKDNFMLEDGQKIQHYGLSNLSLKPGNSVTSNYKMLVKCKVFQSDSPSGGVGFYTVSSYKQSDGTTALDPSDIPLFVDQDRGRSYDLRNVIDGRPQVANTGAFGTTVAAATINPSTTEAFTSADHFIASPDQQFTTDLVYYLGRIDKLMITSTGYITTKKGVPSSKPIPPQDVPDSMNLGTIVVPPYPSLTSNEARSKKRTTQSVKIKPATNRRYTMSEIGQIDRRLKNLEYYTTLSQLEQKTSNMAITDAQGNDRFKNGIFVDPATDLNSSDIRNREFRCKVDPTASVFHPPAPKDDIDLVVANTTNVIDQDGQFMLKASEHLLKEQTGATHARTCTESYYKHFGSVKISPPMDNGYDVTEMPTQEIINDTATGVQELFDGINEFYPLTRTSTELIGSDEQSQTETDVTQDHFDYYWHDWDYYTGYGGHWRNDGYYGHYGRDYGWYGWGYEGYVETTTTTTTTETTDTYLKTTEQLAVGVKETTEKVGDFITDISFNPFMRAKTIKIVAWGLRPNLRHYFYFDNQSIDDKVKKGFLNPPGWTNGEVIGNVAGGIHPKFVEPTGVKGAAVEAGAQGMLAAVFYLPASTFHVGDRELVISDSSSLAGLKGSVSKASVKYNAYNYSAEKTEYTMTTRAPTFSMSSSHDQFEEVTVDTHTDVTSNTYWSWNDNYYDPYYSNGYWTSDGLVINNYANSSVNTIWADSEIGITSINAAAYTGLNFSYDATDLKVYPNTTTTTTGTGDKATGAITGSGGGANNYSYVDDFAKNWTDGTFNLMIGGIF